MPSHVSTTAPNGPDVVSLRRGNLASTSPRTSVARRLTASAYATACALLIRALPPYVPSPAEPLSPLPQPATSPPAAARTSMVTTTRSIGEMISGSWLGHRPVASRYASAVRHGSAMRRGREGGLRVPVEGAKTAEIGRRAAEEPLAIKKCAPAGAQKPAPQQAIRSMGAAGFEPATSRV